MKQTEHAKMRVADLIPATYNPRKITKEAKQGLEASIERFGLLQSIVVNRRNNVVIGGHQRLAILQEKGVDEVDVILVDLDEKDEKAANLALNNKHIQGEFTTDFRDLLTEIAGADDPLFKELRFDRLERSGPKSGGFDIDSALRESIGGFRYRVLVECDDEHHQGELLKRFKAEGLSVKPQIY